MNNVFFSAKKGSTYLSYSGTGLVTCKAMIISELVFSLVEDDCAVVGGGMLEVLNNVRLYIVEAQVIVEINVHWHCHQHSACYVKQPMSCETQLTQYAGEMSGEILKGTSGEMCRGTSRGTVQIPMM